MNQKPERVFADKVFRQETLSFENIPHQSKLFLDFQSNSASVEKFYPEKQTALKNYAERVLDNYKIDRDALCDVLVESNQFFGASEKTFENIQLLREKDCLAIVTGQQAGLFSGAIYTIYKAASAVKLAAGLRKQNIKAVPVFWIAEEDHDFDEVKKTFIIDREGKLAESQNTPEDYTKDFPVGAVKLDKTIKQTITNLIEYLPHTEFTDEIEKMLTTTYQPGDTYSQAFGKFIARLFADYGLIFLSPLNKKLKTLCAPIFAEAVEKSDEINRELLKRNGELEKESYQAQVLAAADFFPFFYQEENGARQALKKNSQNEKIKIPGSKIEFDKNQLKDIAQNSPQKLSPNALMRPVVQDYLLPTLIYFGGAAEVAYFAQNSVIYPILSRPVTPIRHRASFSIVEAKHRRTFEKYDLSLKDLFEGKEKILAEIAEKYLNRETAQIFTDVEENIDAQLNRLDEKLKNYEPTLAANLANRKRKINWHVAALRKKYNQAEILKNEIVARRIENLFAALLPKNALQERTLNVIAFLNLYGVNFIRWIYDAIETDEKNHQILYL